MFKTKNLVRMHDVDITGLLYFPRQFRFVHDALEDFLKSENLNFKHLFQRENFLFVIVHVEADYFAPLSIGEELCITLQVMKIGSTSFTLLYNIFNDAGQKIGSAKTTHVCMNNSTRKKIPIPDKLLHILKKHFRG